MYYLSHVFDQIFDEFFRTSSYCLPKETNISSPTYPVGNLSVDKKDGKATFEFAVSGFSKEDIDVLIEDSRLKIKGKIEEKEDEDRQYIYRKLATRSFDIAYKIPPEYDVEKTDVSLKDGLLSISIPLKPEAKPVTKQLEIK